MKILILGANGSTGKKLVEQLSEMGHTIKVIVRPTSDLPINWNENERFTIIKRSINELSVNELATYIEDCHAVISCLGHNLSFKGVYGNPRKLVTDAVKLVCSAIKIIQPITPVKFILMNTAGNRNRDLNEPISLLQKLIIYLLRLVLPPHPDNEKAADYLRVKIGQNNTLIEWIVIRPDSLIDKEHVTKYELHSSPIRSALINPGKTSRINVGHFMAMLIEDGKLWEKWKGKMPVIYNKKGNQTVPLSLAIYMLILNDSFY